MPAPEDQIVLIPHSLTLAPPGTLQRGILPEHALENTGGSASSRCPRHPFAASSSLRSTVRESLSASHRSVPIQRRQVWLGAAYLVTLKSVLRAAQTPE
jgi:hypothetical protein